MGILNMHHDALVCWRQPSESRDHTGHDPKNINDSFIDSLIH